MAQQHSDTERDIPLHDAHAHLADARLAGDVDGILGQCSEQGVRGVLVNAARIGEWPTVVELCRHPIVLGAVGVHPFFIEAWHDGVVGELAELVRAEPRLVAIGEIGLDFFHGRKAQARQLEVLAAQLSLARELDVPVVLHNRKSWGEFFGCLRDLGVSELRGVCHHFTGSIEIAGQALDYGLHLSFCGPVTYANARRLKEAAAYVPLERLLSETDTPDLPAARYRGQRSLPFHVIEVVAELARLKDTPVWDVAAQIERNFLDLFDAPGILQ